MILSINYFIQCLVNFSLIACVSIVDVVSPFFQMVDVNIWESWGRQSVLIIYLDTSLPVYFSKHIGHFFMLNISLSIFFLLSFQYLPLNKEIQLSILSKNVQTQYRNICIFSTVLSGLTALLIVVLPTNKNKSKKKQLFSEK